MNELTQIIREIISDIDKNLFSDKEILEKINKAFEDYSKDTLLFNNFCTIKMSYDLQLKKPRDYFKFIGGESTVSLIDEQNFSNLDNIKGLPYFFTDKRTNNNFELFPNIIDTLDLTNFFFKSANIFHKDFFAEIDFYGIIDKDIEDFEVTDFYGTVSNNYNIYKNIGVAKKSIGVAKNALGVELVITHQNNIGKIYYNKIANVNEIEDKLAIVYQALNYLYSLDTDIKNDNLANMYHELYKINFADVAKIKKYESKNNRTANWNI